MRKTIFSIILAGLLLMMVPACSSTPQGQDPAKVKVEFTTEPAAIQVGQKVKLIANISGLVTEKGADVQFDIRTSDRSVKPDLKAAQSVGKGRYEVEKMFEKPGTYSVYIHLYQEELHITKKKELQVS
ncbi:FixH family protein [Paenibacillus sp. KN14-4R]|uniref:FixH family protein n=1 Tax=Paenibacillus sp. KN14-4R TaxID=3445773 RepID=UPI003F9F9674